MILNCRQLGTWDFGGTPTSCLLGPVTPRVRFRIKAFCKTRLLDATPRMNPKDRQSMSVLVTTACSACSDDTRTAMTIGC
jgi:hypothetical protein